MIKITGKIKDLRTGKIYDEVIIEKEEDLKYFEIIEEETKKEL